MFRIFRLLAGLAVGSVIAGCGPDEERGSGHKDATPVALDPSVLDCLVEVRSEHGSIGSGFIAKWNDAYFVVTNLHVLAASPSIRFFLSNGEEVRPLNYFAARNQDIAIGRIAETGSYLEIASTGEVRSAHGKRIIVAGNSLGGGVFTALSGHVLGIGGTRIELDARFVSGNSGSPILLDGSRKVIGVASHTVELQLANRDALSSFENTRWFGYRLDTTREWERVHPRDLSRETRQLEEVELRLRQWIALFEGKETTVPSRLEGDFNALARNYNARRIDGTAWPRQDERFRVGVRSIFLRDTRELDSPARYYVNREKSRELRGLRDQVVASLADQ